MGLFHKKEKEPISRIKTIMGINVNNIIYSSIIRKFTKDTGRKPIEKEKGLIKKKFELYGAEEVELSTNDYENEEDYEVEDKLIDIISFPLLMYINFTQEDRIKKKIVFFHQFLEGHKKLLSIENNPKYKRTIDKIINKHYFLSKDFAFPKDLIYYLHNPSKKELFEFGHSEYKKTVLSYIDYWREKLSKYKSKDSKINRIGIIARETEEMKILLNVYLDIIEILYTFQKENANILDSLIKK